MHSTTRTRRILTLATGASVALLLLVIPHPVHLGAAAAAAGGGGGGVRTTERSYLSCSAPGGRALGDDRLPCLKVTGSYYDVGRQVGEAFKDRIIQAYHKSESSSELHEFAKSSTGQAHLNRWKDAVERYPNVVAEMKGIADGSGIDYEEVFLYNCAFEIGIILRKLDSLTSCSDLLVQLPNMVLDGHNEDGAGCAMNTSYLINAQITGNDGTVEEDFAAFAYAGILPGNAFSFNQHGLSFAANAVFEKHLRENGAALPRSVIGRLLISVKTVDELLDKLQGTEGQSESPIWQSVSSFSLNIGDRVNAKVMNIELSTRGISKTTTDNGFLHHFNMFIHTPAPQYMDVSSMRRTAALYSLDGPTDVNSTLRILGDTADKEYPIYRRGHPPDEVYTIATAVYDLLRGVVDIYTTQPLPGATPAYTFSF
ncbi:beta-alanyl-dopamine/carcinine hydrolase-like [Sycon ciliatum]|uniref:beta-alanyl-dopamine/carcinine hydrolase-like n=1 Tax=Sycon ciliatum TaxID=27933 RepID=UPI0020AB1BB5